MGTQTSKIVYDLTQEIIRGELGPDATLAEEQLAERFGVSRTPIRQALSMLSEEGLLEKAGGRSYRVRRFAPREMLEAIEVRGALEGLAARQVAENKIGLPVLRELDMCLAQEERLLASCETEGLTPQTVSQYFTLNSRIHRIIVQGAQNGALSSSIEAANRVPFVAVGSLARYKANLEPKDLRLELQFFAYGHMQHLEIVDAIRGGQGTRAEALMREHAQLAVRNIGLEAGDPTDVPDPLSPGGTEEPE